MPSGTWVRAPLASPGGIYKQGVDCVGTDLGQHGLHVGIGVRNERHTSLVIFFVADFLVRLGV